MGVKNTHQNTTSASIPREGLMQLASDDDLTRKDLKVAIVLLGSIDGFGDLRSDYGKDFEHSPRKRVDPNNFKKIDMKAIAKTCHLKKKDVEKSIERLESLGYLEWGENYTTNLRKGVRWRF